jgi:hypothetical protein
MTHPSDDQNSLPMFQPTANHAAAPSALTTFTINIPFVSTPLSPTPNAATPSATVTWKA